VPLVSKWTSGTEIVEALRAVHPSPCRTSQRRLPHPGVSAHTQSTPWRASSRS
jgi:hypothetical protein